MEQREGPQTPYEVYCYQCQSSFALGTRNCVHCGNRLGGGLAASIESAPTDFGSAPQPSGEAEDESPVVSVAKRVGGPSLWLVFIVGMTLMRMCEGG